MTGLDGQDCASGSQVGCAHDVGRGTEVGADAHAFEDRGSRDEGLDIGDSEAVTASSDWGRAGLCESGGQEGNMGHFVDGDLFEVGVESGVEAGACEVGLGEVLETLLIEGVFEMLKGESVVEDVGVSDGWGALTDLLQEGATVDASVRGSGLRKSTR